MGLDVPGHGQDQATATSQQAERIAELEALRRDRAELSQETCQSRWPKVPEHAAQYLQQECPEHFALAMDEAAALDEAELADPDIAPFLLDDCIQAAQIAALDAGLEQDSSEIAALDGQIGQQAETIALEQAGLAQDNATTEGLTRLRDIALEESELGGGVEALLQRVTARLSEIPEGPERQAAQEQLASVRAMLGQMRSVVTDPQERQAFESILSVSNLNLGASSNLGVFSDVMARVDSSDQLSEETKQQIHETLGVPTVRTGGDVNQALGDGRGTDENGERLPYDENHKIRTAPNNYVYEGANGENIYEMNLPDGRVIKTKFPSGSSDQHTGDLGIFMGSLYAAESLGLGEAIFQRGWNITQGGMIDVHYDDIIKAKRLNVLFLGGMAGYDNELMTAPRIARLKHDYQAFSRQGDWATGDNDPERQREDYQELGILDQNGAVNWQQMERAARYLQTQTSQGGIPEFEDLKRSLQSIEA